jgi:dimethylhistidine N-methyltransferase
MNQLVRELPVALDSVAMRDEILKGLRAQPKTISSKYFYDSTGSRLFNAICNTPEYYLTRVEKLLLSGIAGEVARLIGPESVVIEPGCGNGEKAAMLLKEIHPAAYVPVEISEEALSGTVNRISSQFPWLNVIPACADFTRSDVARLPAGRRLVFFPGSTIGNFEPLEAIRLLSRLAVLAAPGGALVAGVDLKKDPETLNAAYNDGAGVTAAFNLNLLARLNRDLNADFQIAKFRHHAFYDPLRGRVEMHLVSSCEQTVHVAGEAVHFDTGESIHTENSYKYTISEFRDLAGEAGWAPIGAWADADHLFSVQFFARKE